MTKPLLTGVLKTWKEDRGFGFITPNNGGRDIFIHISAIGQDGRRPLPGDIIHYQVARDRQGKLRAINAVIEGAYKSGKAVKQANKGKSVLRWLGLGLLMMLALAAIVYLCVRLGLFK